MSQHQAGQLGSSMMHLTEKPIAQAARYMSPGKLLAMPRELWSDNLTKLEALNFVSAITKMAMSPITDRIAQYLNVQIQVFENTEDCATVIQALTNSIIEDSKVAIIHPFAFPHSRGWKARLAAIRYLTTILVESDRDLHSGKSNYETRLCQYDGIRFTFKRS